MEYYYQLYRLSNRFYTDYPDTNYPELMHDIDRTYSCLLIDANDYYICVPFRSNMHHKNGYHFTTSQRSRVHASGLDFTKIVIVSNNDYLTCNPVPIIDRDEFVEAIKNMNKISQKAKNYVDRYCNHINGSKPLSPEEYRRAYNFSTLQYFHDILGLQAPAASA